MATSEPAYPIVTLKAGREFPLLAGHPWVFSNGVETAEGARTGDVVEIRSRSGDFLGIGTYHGGNTIRVRLLSRGRRPVDEAFFRERFTRLRREKLRHLPPDTDGYRLVHGDADYLPGLVVDLFGKTAVFQIHTAGMEPHREAVVNALAGSVDAEVVVERSDVEARRKEGLSPLPPEVRRGIPAEPLSFREHGLKMLADVLSGQKTGFFLDQRDARREVRRLASGRKVVNLFSYSCAFGLSAAAGGAASVLNVDVSRPALTLGRRMFEENGHTGDRYRFEEADVFDYLEGEKGNLKKLLAEGLLVCDPPAFAKSFGQLEQAKKAYSRLNRLCFELLDPGAILVSSSCSGMLSQEDFSDILRVAAGRAGRGVRILGAPAQPFDHTQLLAFPEGRYLKTLVLEVTGIGA